MKRVFAFILLCFLIACSTKSEDKQSARTEEKKLIVFHAGSLSVPFKAIKEAFEKENPGVEVQLEAAGSRKCARKITDLNRNCDVMASADYTVIDKLLIPEHADWNIKFASNEMCIVYHDHSRKADEITTENWTEILLSEAVTYGRSDPDSDPCGYRAVLCAKLAEQHYQKDGFAAELLAKDQDYIRPKETDLLALLESSSLDYIFLYRSVAEQHGLKYINLPDEMNLKNPELAEHYRQVSTEISGKKPGETITKYGEPMVYGVCIPKSSEQPELAKVFVSFLLDAKKGMKIMEANGQPSIVPSATSSFEQIPEELKVFAKK